MYIVPRESDSSDFYCGPGTENFVSKTEKPLLRNWNHHIRDIITQIKKTK